MSSIKKSNPNNDGIKNKSNLDFEILSAGIIGKLFGTEKNGPNNIAGVCIVGGILVGCIVTIIMLFKNNPYPFEIWNYVTPIITGSLGFIFGKSP